MDVLKVIVPIFVIIFLGILAKRNELISIDENKGLQQFVMKFGLPCVLFNSCLTSQLGVESLTTMILVLPFMLLSSLWSFYARKKKYPISNLPMMFSAQESGMLGIPLFMSLFGASQAYRIGILDMIQSLIAIPVIAILSTDTNESSSIVDIIKNFNSKK